MIRLHNQNRTHTFIDVESGQFISLPKDETDKPPVNADINGLQPFGKSTQDGEPSPENPVDNINIPPEFDLTVCGKNLWQHTRDLSQTVYGVKLTYDPITNEYTINGTATASASIYVKGTASGPSMIPSIGKRFILAGKHISGSSSGHLSIVVGRPEGNGTLHYIDFSTDVLSVSPILSSNCNHLRFYFALGRVYNNLKFKVFLGYDDIEPDFSKYQGTTYPYRLEGLDGNLHELCSLPDGTRDEYDRDNGVLIKRVKRLTVTSGTTSEPIALQVKYWSAGADATDFSIYWSDTTNRWQSALGVSYNLRCNILNPGSGLLECSLSLRPDETALQIRCATELFISRGYTLDVNGVRQYINDIINANGKPIVFDYPYSEPQIIPIKQYGKTYNGQVWLYNQKPKSIQYHTNIFTDVGAEMQCEVRKLGNRAMGTFNWVTENGDKITTEDGDYIMFEY